MSAAATIRRFCAVAGAMLLIAAAGGVTAAHGYVLEGSSWPGGTIRYHDAGPNPAAVKAAAHAWNESGARVHFVAVPRGQAQVLITTLRGGRCFGVGGYAQLGYSPGRVATMRLSRCRRGHLPVITAAHELGHILGLAHEDHGCTTMNTSVGLRCASAPAYFETCQILRADDVRGAVARYGGRVKPISRREFCPFWSAPGTPTGLAISGAAPGAAPSNADQLVARFEVAPARRLQRGFQRPWVNAEVYRYPGTCPAGRPTDRPIAQAQVTSSGPQEVRLDYRVGLAPGAYCYAIWTVDGAQRRSRAAATATVTVVHLPPAADFGTFGGFEADDWISFDDRSTPGEGAGSIARWEWDFGDPSSADNRSAESDPDHRYARPGTYTVTLTVTDDAGQRATIAKPVTFSPGVTP